MWNKDTWQVCNLWWSISFIEDRLTSMKIGDYVAYYSCFLLTMFEDFVSSRQKQIAFKLEPQWSVYFDIQRTMTSSVYDVIDSFQVCGCVVNFSSRLKPIQESFIIIFAINMRFILQIICCVIIWWLAIIDEYQWKTWANFNTNRRVCSQELMFFPKISFVGFSNYV